LVPPFLCLRTLCFLLFGILDDGQRSETRQLQRISLQLPVYTLPSNGSLYTNVRECLPLPLSLVKLLDHDTTCNQYTRNVFIQQLRSYLNMRQGSFQRRAFSHVSCGLHLRDIISPRLGESLACLYVKWLAGMH
jgi:hypothetical protein